MVPLPPFFKSYTDRLRKVRLLPTRTEYSKWGYNDKFSFWSSWLGIATTVFGIFSAFLFTSPDEEIKQNLDKHSKKLETSLDSVHEQYSSVKGVLSEVNSTTNQFKNDYSEFLKNHKILEHLYQSTNSYEIDISPYNDKSKNIGVLVLKEIFNHKMGQVITLKLHLTKEQQRQLLKYEVLDDMEGTIGPQAEFDNSNCLSDNLFNGYRIIPMLFVPDIFEDFNREETNTEIIRKLGHTSFMATYSNIEIQCRPNDLRIYYDSKKGIVFGKFYVDCVRMFSGGETYYRIIPFDLYKAELAKVGVINAK